MIINYQYQFNNFFTTATSPRIIDFIILHHIAANSFDEAITMLKDHQVSSHYLIDIDGEILSLVNNRNIAYHAGISSWGEFDNLNGNSIGIEIINPKPFSQYFTYLQMQSLINLLQILMAKFRIDRFNIIGHSDIAYHTDTKLLDRKQDPSHFFNWKMLANNKIGNYSQYCSSFIDSFNKEFWLNDKILISKNDKSNNGNQISIIKHKLRKIGYKINNFNNDFDDEMLKLNIVFLRHFNQKFFNDKIAEQYFVEPLEHWYLSSQLIIDDLVKNL